MAAASTRYRRSPVKQLACGSVVPGCTVVFQAQTEREILERVAVHAREDHGMEEFSSEVVAQVRANIKDV